MVSDSVLAECGRSLWSACDQHGDDEVAHWVLPLPLPRLRPRVASPQRKGGMRGFPWSSHKKGSGAFTNTQWTVQTVAKKNKRKRAPRGNKKTVNEKQCGAPRSERCAFCFLRRVLAQCRIVATETAATSVQMAMHFS